MIRIGVTGRIFAEDIDDVIRRTQTGPKKAALTLGRNASVEQATAYDAYPPSKRSLASRLESESRAAFIDCWEAPGARVRAIKSHLLACVPHPHQQRCPYCRLEREASTFDHVVEKSRLPELAFHYRNLVPSCWDCNHRRAKTFDSDGTQHVIHFYDDPVELMPDILRARLEAIDGRPAAAFFVAADGSPAGQLYTRHFDALHLATRYRLWATDELLRVRRVVLACADQATDWRRHIEVEMKQAAADWGHNEPLVALYGAALSQPELIELMVHP